MRHPKRRPRSARLRPSSSSVVEALESRVLLSTYMVTNHLDSGPGSLRTDIQLSNTNPGPNTIMFSVTGTIALSSGELEISQDLTISGPGASSLTLDAGQLNFMRVFRVDAGVTASISGLTITRGSGASNVANGDGGAIYNAGNLSISACTLSANVADADGSFGDGGAIYNAGNLTISGSTLSGSRAHNGEAIYTMGGRLTVVQCTITNNTPDINSYGGSGGGIYSASGEVTVSDSTISNNRTEDAGYTYTTVGAVPGQAGSGGGICNIGADLSLVDDLITGNTTGKGGGGNPYSTPPITPTSGGAGGGIYSTGALHLANVTVVGNTTGIGGESIGHAGALFAYGGAGPGAGIFSGGNSILNNTIVAQNMQPAYAYVTSAREADVTSSVDPSSGYNLIGDGAGATGLSAANHNVIGTDLNPIDPKLSPLGNYGGPTETMPPVPGSPVIDAGSNALAIGPDGTPLATDQRGQPRIQGAAVDIGSVEAPATPFPLVVTNTSDAFDVNYGSSNLSLREALAFANLSHGPATISFAPGMSGAIALDRTLGPLELANSVGAITIKGPGPGAIAVSATSTRAFQIDNGVSGEIDGLGIGSRACYELSR